MAVQISGNDITVPRDGTFSRNVSIAGTLTYEDVTNVDSIGIVTARNGIEVGARPGVAASISVDGNMIVSGITTFGGDVQVPDKIIHSGDTNTAIRFPAADIVTVETGGSERFRVLDSGGITVKNGDDQYSTTFEGGSSGSRNFVSVKAGNTTSGHNSGFRVTHSDGNTVLSANVNHNDDNANIMNEHQGGALIFHTNESGSVTEKLRIKSDGKVGIGTLSPSVLLDVAGHAGSGAQTTIRSKSTDSNASNFVRAESSDDKYIGFLKYGSGHSAYGALAAGGGAVYANSSVPVTIMSDGSYINFATGGSTEKARIDSNGRFMVGTTNHSSNTGIGIKLAMDTTNPSVNTVINQSAGNHSFYHLYNTNATHNAYRFYVQTNGGVANHSGNNVNLSDERMKKNITNMGSVYDTFKQFVFRDFNYIDDGASDSKKHGLIAQEVETIDSDLITEDFKIAPDSEGNDVYRKALKEEQFMMIGLKALQEAMTKIDALESEVAALKSQLNN